MTSGIIFWYSENHRGYNGNETDCGPFELAYRVFTEWARQAWLDLFHSQRSAAQNQKSGRDKNKNRRKLQWYSTETHRQLISYLKRARQWANTAYLRKDKLVIYRRVYDLEFSQGSYQIQNSDKSMGNHLTENHVSHQQSPQRQILEVNRQRESATRKHVQETKDTILQSHEQGRREAGIRHKQLTKNELPKVTNTVYLNIQMMTWTVSAIQNTRRKALHC